jgi:hypothetical protein
VQEGGDKAAAASSSDLVGDSDSDQSSSTSLPLVLNFGFQLRKGDKCDCLDSIKKTRYAAVVTERDTTHVRVSFSGGQNMVRFTRRTLNQLAPIPMANECAQLMRAPLFVCLCCAT